MARGVYLHSTMYLERREATEDIVRTTQFRLLACALALAALLAAVVGLARVHDAELLGVEPGTDSFGSPVLRADPVGIDRLPYFSTNYELATG